MNFYECCDLTEKLCLMYIYRTRRKLEQKVLLLLSFFLFYRFEIAIFILIFLNMVSMGIEHYNQSRVVTFTLEICNALFTTIFSLGKKDIFYLLF